MLLPCGFLVGVAYCTSIVYHSDGYLVQLIHLGIHTELSLEAIQDLQLQSFTVSLCKVKLTVCMCEHALNLDFNPD